MNFISYILLGFAVLGALDWILGNRFGLGKEFERGFMLLGNMALSMAGMIVLAPWIAELLAPAFDWFYAVSGIDPSLIPASLFANDMGGASVAAQIAKNQTVGMFNALVVSSMMGCTVSFTIPYAMSVVKKEHHKELFLGLLCGIVTIPVGCLLSGLFVRIPFSSLLLNLLPLILFSAIIACGLLWAPNITVKIFRWLGFGIKAIIITGLLLGSIEFLTGIELIPALADLQEGASICFNAAIVLAGAFPLMHLISKLLARPLKTLEKKLQVDPTSALGFLCAVVSCTPVYDMMNQMNKKGILLNAAFAVSAGFVFGGHLAFTMAFNASLLSATVIAKLISGLCAFALSLMIYKRVYSKPKTIANNKQEVSV